MTRYPSLPYCGCFVPLDRGRKFLPQVSIDAVSTIFASTSRTTLTQTFVNPDKASPLDRVSYTFPLYDGVSVVAFTCTVGSKVIKGVVRDRNTAKKDFQDAVDRGETAGLLEQSRHAADVFTTTLGNVPPGATIKVDLTYLGELKHDAQVDGLRFVIPTCIAPRYASHDLLMPEYSHNASDALPTRISMTVDAEMPAGNAIKNMQSPSHPISVSIGTTSLAPDAEPSLQKASASLTLGTASLEKDFIITVVATNLGEPTAVLETHPTLPDQHVLMTTLVPKFNLPSERPEIVFICDRSGSMGGKIQDLTNALNLFLKSLPVGVKFNICSFGSSFSFLWEKSQTYGPDTLESAANHVKMFLANFGGTEMYQPVEETFKRRYKDMNLEVFLLTDGEIWQQEALFDLINRQVTESKGAVRVFTLGVGKGVSHALIEGVARAGNGISQSVAEDEKMDKKVIRMLKASLTPHVTDYTLEVRYKDSSDDDFELVEKVESALVIGETTEEVQDKQESVPKKPISLFDKSVGNDDDTIMSEAPDVYKHLPAIETPRYLQAPTDIPPLFPFTRTTVYVFLPDVSSSRYPESVLLKATSTHGPLELEIPVRTSPDRSATIHQLAARKAIKELEEGRGWLAKAKNSEGKLLKDVHEGRFSDMVEREAVRLGLRYQVAGKWTSFVAVEDNGKATQLSDPDTLAASEPRRVKHNFAQFPAPASHVSFRASAGGGLLSSMSSRTLNSAWRQPQQQAGSPPSTVLSSVAPQRTSNSPEESDDDMGYALFEGVDPSPPAAVDYVPEQKRSRKKMPKFKRHGPPMEEDTVDVFTRLVDLQTFSGKWEWTDELSKLTGISGEELGQLKPPGNSSDHLSVLATASVVVYLKTKLANEKDSWEMIVEKAREWMEGETGVTADEVEKCVEGLVQKAATKDGN